MFLMQDLQDLWEHVGYMVLCSPDHFPYRGFLSDNDQMNMEKGFTQLHEGILIAYPEDKYSSCAYTGLRASLSDILEQAYAAYQIDDVVKGAHLLQDFRDKIFVKKGKVRMLVVSA